MTDAKAIAQAVAEALAKRVTVKGTGYVVLQKAGDVASMRLLQAGTLEQGDITPKKLNGIISRLRKKLPKTVASFSSLFKPEGVDSAEGWANEARVRVVRSYNVADDDWLTRVDVLVAL